MRVITVQETRSADPVLQPLERQPVVLPHDQLAVYVSYHICLTEGPRLGRLLTGQGGPYRAPALAGAVTGPGSPE